MKRAATPQRRMATVRMLGAVWNHTVEHLLGGIVNQTDPTRTDYAVVSMVILLAPVAWMSLS